MPLPYISVHVCIYIYLLNYTYISTSIILINFNIMNNFNLKILKAAVIEYCLSYS